MDSILYYASTDNRIIVDLDKEKYLHILYNEFKRKKELHWLSLELRTGYQEQRFVMPWINHIQKENG